MTEDPLENDLNKNQENSSLDAISGVSESKIENEDKIRKDNM